MLRDSAQFLLAPYFKNKQIEPSVDLAKNGTKGVPLLLYRPTRLIKSQKEEIETQTEETEERISKMEKEFDVAKEKTLKEVFELKKSIEEVHDVLDKLESDGDKEGDKGGDKKTDKADKGDDWEMNTD